MAKQLFDVFPSLKFDDELRNLYETTVVEKLTATKKKDMLRVYITSDRLIERQYIKALEDGVKQQYFSKDDLRVVVIETFHLNEQYTPENLLELYSDSLLQEIEEEDEFLSVLLRGISFTYPAPDVVELHLKDNSMVRDEEDKILDFFTSVLNKRCGVTARVDIVYEEEKKKDFEAPDYTEESSHRAAVLDALEKEKMQKRMERAARKAEKEAEKKQEEEEKKEEKKPQSTGFSNTKSFGKGKSTFTGKSGGAWSFKGNGGAKSDDPHVIYGRDFDEDPIHIRDIEGDAPICIHGKVLNYESKPTKKGNSSIITFAIYDFTDSISCKIFAPIEDEPELSKRLKPGSFIKLTGVKTYDTFAKEEIMQSITGIRETTSFETKRDDNAPIKRVELHCHTKMSDMDGVSEVKDIVKQAYRWGMPGIAITDHGVVQALTDANHVWEDLWKAESKKRKEVGDTRDRQDFFKVVQGVEAYVVDDLKEIVVNDKHQSLLDSTYVIFDIETTGFSPVKDRIIEIGAIKMRNGEILDKFSEFINPKRPIPYRITNLTSITDEMVMDAPAREEIIPRFVEFCEGAVLVGHNVAFDISFINQNCKELGIPADYTTVDTLGLSRVFLPLQAKHTLDAVAKTLKIDDGHHHRAVDDANTTFEIYKKFLPMLQEKKVENLSQINPLGVATPDMIKHLRPNHCILLAKNTVGRVNMYTLVSKSHVEYFRRFPLIPKSELLKYREGLIIGSACCAGELYGAVREDRPAQEIARMVNFYDYLEIQPLGNNRFMIDSDRYDTIQSDEDLIAINKEIIRLGEQYHKPVVATCDVHFLDPEDEIYRTIIMAGKGMDDEEPAPLYLRTTDEMLAEFEYLGREKAEEICITNPRKIVDMCDSISPVRPDKCPPVIEDSDNILTKICYDKAHELYGEELPEIVEERLQRELNSIIKNGFAVMYIIAQKLVWKSNEDGYLVGSRGSVGSSFVAFTSGITEVNSLAPHYVCPNCHYSDFDSEEVRKFAGNSGCDMPDKRCPVCGHMLYKDGFDIPFETFLGFKGDKEPDIDLNFSGEYQSKAHKYTEVIFGNGQTFRAGTVSGLADKTAYGYAKKYYDGLGEVKHKCEIDRIVQHLMGIRTGTGQHPGGIIVLPVGDNIYSFTPVQHPANKDVETITTHFDYHSIDHNLLKLDILGHDDPTMIRFLQDCTGLDPKEVPLDDPEVMRLFMDTSSIGVTPEQIGGTKLGCLGMPEFGTDFAMQMVIDAQPSTFSHLIRISGLSHGTDVWLGNAKDLIEEGTATLDTAICCRDDIMNYLIQKGLDKSDSFKIMEAVRKGMVSKGKVDPAQWEKWKQDMLDHDVPQWYIDSCKKIKYMFPKAHAAAYVMMAWRIGYFKVYVPQAYYSAWFSIRAKQFSYTMICQGENHLHGEMQRIDNMKKQLEKEHKKLGATDQDMYYTMRLAEEMYERGIEFEKIDIFKAKSRLFQVVGDKIMPSLTSIDGMGETAADAVVEACKQGPFLSRDDFRERTKCPQKVIDTMAQLGLLGDLPESNQISMFDLL